MKKIEIPVLMLLIIALPACHVFLGGDPDTGPEEVLYRLWKDFNEIHAYIDIRMSNNQDFDSWDDVYDYYNKLLIEKLTGNEDDPYRSNRTLFDICTGMLGELNDAHVSLHTPMPAPFHKWPIKERDTYAKGHTERVKGYLKDEGSAQFPYFLYGTFSPELLNHYLHPDLPPPELLIGYIHIESFDDESSDTQDWVKKIDDIVKFLKNTDAIIVDVRYNGGGLSSAGDYIAARFAAKAEDYVKTRIKSGPERNDFYPPVTSMIIPAGESYIKPILLLTNKNSVSATEWFTLALRTQEHVTHAGTTTSGAFSSRVERPMINGWYYSISMEKVTGMDETIYEGIGIIPSVELTNSGELPYDEDDGKTWYRLQNTDRQLERVLKYLVKENGELK